MARTITVTLANGQQITYQNVPEDVSADQVIARTQNDFPGVGIRDVYRAPLQDGEAAATPTPTPTPGRGTPITDRAAPETGAEEEEPGFFSEVGRSVASGFGASVAGVNRIVEELPTALFGRDSLIAQMPGVGLANELINRPLAEAVAPAWREFVSPATRPEIEAGERLQREYAVRTPGPIQAFQEGEGLLDSLWSGARSTLIQGAGFVPQLVAAAGVGRVSPAAGAALLGASSTGASYEGIRQTQEQAGIDDPGMAFSAALASGLLDATTGLGGRAISATTRNALRQDAMRGISGALREVGKTGVSESATEMLQNVIEQVGGGQDPLTQESLLQTLDAGIIGFGSGVVLGTPIEGLNRRQQSNLRRAFGQQPSLRTVDVNVPGDGGRSVPTTLDILSAPDANGNIVVRTAEGTPYVDSLSNIEAMRPAPTEGETRENLADALTDAEMQNADNAALAAAVNALLSDPNDGSARGLLRARLRSQHGIPDYLADQLIDSAIQTAATSAPQTGQEAAATSVVNSINRAATGKNKAVKAAQEQAVAEAQEVAAAVAQEQPKRRGKKAPATATPTATAPIPPTRFQPLALNEATTRFPKAEDADVRNAFFSGAIGTTPEDFFAGRKTKMTKAVVEGFNAGRAYGAEQGQPVSATELTLTRPKPQAATAAPVVDRKAAFNEANSRFDPKEEDNLATAFYNAATGMDRAIFEQQGPTEGELDAWEQGLKWAAGSQRGGAGAGVPSAGGRAGAGAAATPTTETDESGVGVVGGVAGGPATGKGQREPTVTKVAPGEARGIRETRTGMMGTQRGRPVEGAAALTEGMRAEQELYAELEAARQRREISDEEMAQAINTLRPPVDRDGNFDNEAFKALPADEKSAWGTALAAQKAVDEQAEVVSAIPKEVLGQPNPERVDAEAELAKRQRSLDDAQRNLVNIARDRVGKKATERKEAQTAIRELLKDPNLTEEQRRDLQIQLQENKVDRKYRRKGAGAGLDVNTVKAHIAKVISGWRAKVDVQTVESLDELPADVREAVIADGAQDAQGLVAPDGTIYIFAQNLDTLEDATATVYHEALGHMGLKALFGKRLDSVLQSILDSNKNLREAAEQWMRDNPGAYQGDNATLRALEEVLVERSEGGRLQASIWSKIVGVFKDFGRRIGMKLDYTDSEVRTLLAMAHDMVVDGPQTSAAMDGLRYMAMGGDRIRLQRKYGEIKPDGSVGFTSSGNVIGPEAQAAKTFLKELGVFNNGELYTMPSEEAILKAERIGIDEEWLNYYNDSYLRSYYGPEAAPNTPQPDMSKYAPDVPLKYSRKKAKPKTAAEEAAEAEAKAQEKTRKGEAKVQRSLEAGGLRDPDAVASGLNEATTGASELFRQRLDKLVEPIEGMRRGARRVFRTTDSLIMGLRRDAPATAAIAEQVREVLGRMQATQISMIKAMGKIGRGLDTFLRSSPDANYRIANTMHLSRIFSFDPTLYKDRADALANDRLSVDLRAKLKAEKDAKAKKQLDGRLRKRQADINAVWNSWEKLGKLQGGHYQYRSQKQFFEDMHTALTAVLDSNIDMLDMPQAQKDKLKASHKSDPDELTDSDHEYPGVKVSLLDDVYFPFLRFGDFVMTAKWKGKNGRRARWHFDTNAERKAYERAFRKEYAEDIANRDVEIDFINAADAMAADLQESAFLRDVFKAIEKPVPKGSTDEQAAAFKKQIKDRIYQVYLMTLPERSIRKQFIHAKLVEGQSPDVGRVFADSARRYASQLPKMIAKPQMDRLISEGAKSLEGMQNVSPAKKEKMTQLFNLFAGRATQEFDNQEISGVQKFVNLSAFGLLMTGVLSTYVQTIAFPQQAMPRMLTMYPKQAAPVITNYLRVFGELPNLVIEIDPVTGERMIAMPSFGNTKFIQNNKVRQRLFTQMQERGFFAQHQTDMMLRGMAEGKPGLVGTVGNAYEEAVRGMGIPLTSMDQLVREMTALMFAEMEYNKSKDVDKAVKSAMQNTDDTLGNYSDLEQPGIFRGYGGRFLRFLRTYSVQRAKYFGRMFATVFMGSPYQTRVQAIGELVLTGFMTTLFGGIGANFLYSTFTTLAEALFSLLMDDEEEEEFRRENPLSFGGTRTSMVTGTEFNANKHLMYSVLPRLFGEDTGMTRGLQRGFASDLLNVDLSSRVSQDDLFIRDWQSGDNYAETILNAIGANLAPQLSAGLGIAKGFNALQEGDWQRAIKGLTPALFRGKALAEEYRQEGIRSTSGDPMLTADYFAGMSTGESRGLMDDLTAVAIGGQPFDVAALYEEKLNRVYDLRAATKDRKDSLMAEMRRELQQNNIDQERVADIAERMLEFNRTLPPDLYYSNVIDLPRVMESMERVARDPSYYGTTVTKDEIILLMREDGVLTDEEADALSAAYAMERIEAQ